MKIVISEKYERLRKFIEQIPTLFTSEGTTLHDGRNIIKLIDCQGERYVVKCYKTPNPFNRIIYSCMRQTKAHRAYRHAQYMTAMGVDTPEEVAYIETRRHTLIDKTYFISRYSDYTPLTEVTSQFPNGDSRQILSAFADFAASLHKKGILHHDFNQSNVLYKRVEDRYEFQIIDINRMSFKRVLSKRQCMRNLKRLGCPPIPFLYILEQYIEHRDWNESKNILIGTIMRLLFERRQQVKSELKRLRR